MFTIRHKARKIDQTATRPRSRVKGLAAVALLSGTLVAGPAPLPVPRAEAATYACPRFDSWQDWLGGARVHAQVSFRGSDVCNGKHVRRAYVNIIRQCGPYLQTGRIYTSVASSSSDTTRRSVHVWIFDSVLWWCQTNTYYGYEYFGGSGGGGGGGAW